MRASYRLIVYILLLFISVQDAIAWGQKGHDVTCRIAECHLDRSARKAVSSLLQGKSMVYWGNWLDNASHTPQYAHTKTWHYKNVDADMAYEDAPLEPRGDVVTAITEQVSILKNRASSPQEKSVALKMLIHLVGDIHQPMHLGHRTDLGGNLWQVTFFGSETNLHSIWDTDILESGHRWSYEEWTTQIDIADKAQRALIQRGTPDDWARETFVLATEIYLSTPQNSELSYDYVARWAPLIEQQLLRAGLRLAHILNEIF